MKFASDLVQTEFVKAADHVKADEREQQQSVEVIVTQMCRWPEELKAVRAIVLGAVVLMVLGVCEDVKASVQIRDVVVVGELETTAEVHAFVVDDAFAVDAVAAGVEVVDVDYAICLIHMRSILGHTRD